MPRSFDEECKFVERISNVKFRIRKEFVPNMQVRISIVFLLISHSIAGRGCVLCEQCTREAHV